MADVAMRRDEKLLCGRLVALPSTVSVMGQTTVKNNPGLNNTISIDFPAMPDVIELARSAEYAVSQNSLTMPDGIHQYKGTKPLEIPFSFRIHSFDQQYCKKGALTLLQLAARLHSFVLPINTLHRTIPPLASSTNTQVGGGSPYEAKMRQYSDQARAVQASGAGGSKTGNLNNPVTCWLLLMWAGENLPGISAYGYVREVNVKLNGPWLRGPGGSYNLPTSGDFSFVFVHHPSHANAQAYTNSQAANTITETGNAFADDVRDRLYNTRSLIHAANTQGFGNNPSNDMILNP